MSYSTFTDPKGQKWQVWSVNPTDVECRKRDRRDATPSVTATYVGTERRTTADDRRNPLEAWSVVKPGFEHGWLCFEKEDGEKRRLTPIPGAWENATAEKLWNWCNEAAHVSKRGSLGQRYWWSIRSQTMRDSAFRIASVEKIEVSQGRVALVGAKKDALWVDVAG